jgi:hypothetical protein
VRKPVSHTIPSNEQISAEEWRQAETLEAALVHASPAVDDEIAGLLAVSQRVTGLTQAMAPPSLGLVRRVERLAQAPAPTRWAWPIRRLWPAAAALAVLLIALTVTGPGRGALASLYARLNLGDADVSVTPDSVPVGPRFTTAYRESLAGLAEARTRVAFPVLEPQTMPVDYALHAVAAISYEGMPLWFPKPFYIELDYRSPHGAAMAHDLTIRQFGMALGEQGGIKNLRFAADQVAESHAVDVNGQPALMVVHRAPAGQPVRELVWQKGDVMLELLSQTLASDDMMHIAASMQ